MNNALLIARRELGSYLRSPMGYIVLSLALLVDGIYFYAKGLGSVALTSQDVLWRFFDGTTVVTMIVAVVLTMRQLAGERETGTMVLLNTAPVRDIEIVAGKFLGSFALIFALTALSAYMPLLIFWNGKVAVAHILVGYLGVLLLGAATLAVGLFASALARTQVIAAVFGAALLTTMFLFWLVSRVLDPPLNTFVSALSIHPERQIPFMKGLLKLENVIYYVAVAYFFLLATTKTLEARRWR